MASCHKDLGELVAHVCTAPMWDECWCDKTVQNGGCRNCETYQVFWGLDPLCGKDGKPADPNLLKQQKTMRQKYMH